MDHYIFAGRGMLEKYLPPPKESCKPIAKGKKGENKISFNLVKECNK